MILPVSYPETVNFLDLTDYENIFDDCSVCFIEDFMHTPHSIRSKDTTLPVFTVGSYEISVAMNINDINKIDKKTFSILPDCKTMLSTTYQASYWGFIICKLTNNTDKIYHPIAYTHQLLPNQAFIPTKHYHNHDSYIKKILGYIFNYTNDNNKVADWHHKIYLLNLQHTRKKWDSIPLITSHNQRYYWNKEFRINVKKIKYDFGSIENFEKLRITGAYDNVDLFLSY